MTAAGINAPGFEIGDDLIWTYDPTGARVDLSPAMRAVVTAHNAGAAPSAPNYGADLLSDRDMQEQLATAVQQIRAYRALTTPTAAQQKAYDDLIGRIALHYLKTRFPSL